MSTAYSYDPAARKISGPGLILDIDIVESDEDAQQFVIALNLAYDHGHADGAESERRRARADINGPDAPGVGPPTEIRV